jgi:hypothetical protein
LRMPAGGSRIAAIGFEKQPLASSSCPWLSELGLFRS